MLRILVVDDDQTTLETYHAVLRQEGYAVGLANSCATAIQSLSQRGAPHAMFLDLNLRRESGFDILRWMRVNQLFVPTAVMTAFRMTFDPDEAFELGALAYVDQPLSVETLISVSRSLTRSMSPLDDPNAVRQ